MKLRIGTLCDSLQAGRSVYVCHGAKTISGRCKGVEHMRTVDSTPEPPLCLLAQAHGCYRPELLALFDNVQSLTSLVAKRRG